MKELRVGMKLFCKNSRNDVTDCKVIKIYNDQGSQRFDVKFSKMVRIKKHNRFTDTITDQLSNTIGQTFFFEESDTSLSIEELAVKDDYIKYGNSMLLKKSIMNILKKRNINFLVYFSNIENLNSILEHGIVPEIYHAEKNIYPQKYKLKKNEIQINGNGYSIEFPNYKVLTLIRKSRPSDRFVIFQLDAFAVLCDNILNKMFYCTDNALSNSKKFTNAIDFEKLFSPVYEKEAYEYNGTPKKEIRVSRNDLNIPARYPTNPQAEIIISNTISAKYIKNVVFEAETDKQKWLKQNPEMENTHLNFIVNKNLFGPRIDWEFWPSTSEDTDYNTHTDIVNNSKPDIDTVKVDDIITVLDNNDGSQHSIKIYQGDMPDIDSEIEYSNYEAPVGKSLLNKRKGDNVYIELPDGFKKTYTILSIERQGDGSVFFKRETRT